MKKNKCVICGKEISGDEIVIVEEAQVCRNRKCIDKEIKRNMNEQGSCYIYTGDKGDII